MRAAKLYLLSILLVATTAGVAVAVSGMIAGDNPEPAKWAKVGLWDIDVDRDAGNTCFAVRWFLLSGTVIRIGVNPGGNGFHFLIGGGKALESLETGKTYRLRFVSENGTTHERDFDARTVRGHLIFINHAIGDDFIADFTSQDSMRVYLGNSRVATLWLVDAKSAFAQVMACQSEMTASATSRDNP
jgi:hypothetical protein